MNEEDYREALASIYNCIMNGDGWATDQFKPLSASTANQIADFALAVYRGTTPKEYFDKLEEVE